MVRGVVTALPNGENVIHKSSSVFVSGVVSSPRVTLALRALSIGVWLSI